MILVHLFIINFTVVKIVTKYVHSHYSHLQKIKTRHDFQAFFYAMTSDDIIQYFLLHIQFGPWNSKPSQNFLSTVVGIIGCFFYHLYIHAIGKKLSLTEV